MRLVRNGVSVVLWLISFASAFLAIYSHDIPTYIAVATDIRGRFNQRPVILGKAYAGLYAGAGAIGFIHNREMIDDPEGAYYQAIPPRSLHLIWDHSANPAATLQGSASLEELSDVIAYTRFGVTLYDGDDDWAGGSQNNRGWLINAWIFIFAPPLLILILFAIPRLLLRRSHIHGFCPNCQYDLRVQLEGGAGARCPECGRPARST